LDERSIWRGLNKTTASPVAFV